MTTVTPYHRLDPLAPGHTPPPRDPGDRGLIDAPPAEPAADPIGDCRPQLDWGAVGRPVIGAVLSDTRTGRPRTHRAPAPMPDYGRLAALTTLPAAEREALSRRRQSLRALAEGAEAMARECATLADRYDARADQADDAAVARRLRAWASDARAQAGHADAEATAARAALARLASSQDPPRLEPRPDDTEPAASRPRHGLRYLPPEARAERPHGIDHLTD